MLTAAAMRAAEAAAIAQGATVDSLMDRAGRGVAEAVRRLGGGSPVLILCGPGNNGGDGYVAAAALKAMGLPVRVAATRRSENRGGAARRARGGPAPSSRSRPRPPPRSWSMRCSAPVCRARWTPRSPGRCARLAGEARLSIAVDLPSGVGTDDGAALGDVPRFDLTLALGAAKPAHLLQPAARYCGKFAIARHRRTRRQPDPGARSPRSFRRRARTRTNTAAAWSRSSAERCPARRHSPRSPRCAREPAMCCCWARTAQGVAACGRPQALEARSVGRQADRRAADRTRTRT